MNFIQRVARVGHLSTMGMNVLFLLSSISLFGVFQYVASPNQYWHIKSLLGTIIKELILENEPL